MEAQSGFDLVCIILGFLTDIATKLAAGRAPPVLARIDASFIGDLIDGNLSKAEKSDFTLLTSGLSLSVTSLLAVYSAISALKKIGNEASGGSVDKVTPNRATQTIKTLLSIVSALASYPSSTTGVSYEVRKWAVYRSVISITGEFASTWVIGADDEAAKTKVEVFKDLLSVTKFGLYETAYVEDLDAGIADTEMSVLGALQTVETTFAAAGHSVIVLEGDPEIQAVAIGVEQCMCASLQVTKGVTLRRTAEKRVESDCGVVPDL